MRRCGSAARRCATIREHSKVETAWPSATVRASITAIWTRPSLPFGAPRFVRAQLASASENQACQCQRQNGLNFQVSLLPPAFESLVPHPRLPEQGLILRAASPENCPPTEKWSASLLLSLRTLGVGVVSLQLMKGLAMRRAVKHMNPPAAVPHITGAGT
jgi:hypothetical protein